LGFKTLALLLAFSASLAINVPTVYAHPAPCGLAGCYGVGPQGIHPLPDNAILQQLIYYQPLIFVATAFGAFGFGLFALLKNRARKPIVNQ
jgi:hypothetical protein